MKWFYPTLARCHGHSFREGATFFDAGGNRLGECSAHVLREGATFFDASGDKLGESRPTIDGAGAKFFDCDGQEVGKSIGNVFGNGITFYDRSGKVGELVAQVGGATYYPFDAVATQRANRAGFRFLLLAIAAAVVFFVIAYPAYDMLSSSWGWPLWSAALVMTAIMFSFLVLFERTVLERMMRWRASRYEFIIWGVTGLVCGAGAGVPTIGFAGVAMALVVRWLMWRRR